MIWIMLATLVVVFVVGFRVLTSGSRRAIRRLSERLNIDVVPVESMIDQMGKVQGEAFLQYLHRPDESHLQNAAQVLLIWQIVIVDGSEQNLLQWHRWLQRPGWLHRLPTRRCVWRSVFYARWSRICRSLMRSKCAITPFSSLKMVCTGCTDSPLDGATLIRPNAVPHRRPDKTTSPSGYKQLLKR